MRVLPSITIVETLAEVLDTKLEGENACILHNTAIKIKHININFILISFEKVKLNENIYGYRNVDKRLSD